MAKISYSVGHGWSQISNVRGGYSGGWGSSPNPRWDTPQATATSVEKPEVGDVISWAFSDRLFTGDALDLIGLKIGADGATIEAK